MREYRRTITVPRMTQRYAHLSPDYMAGEVGKLDCRMDAMLEPKLPNSALLGG